MQVHALIWLHACHLWLFILFLDIVVLLCGDHIAIKNLDLEINIGVFGDHIVTDWCLSLDTTISKMAGAVKHSLIAFMELSDSKVPTFNDFIRTKCECLWPSIGGF